MINRSAAAHGTVRAIDEKEKKAEMRTIWQQLCTLIGVSTEQTDDQRLQADGYRSRE